MKNRRAEEIECERKEKKNKPGKGKENEEGREEKRKRRKRRGKKMTYLCSSLSICFAREILFLMEDI